MEIILFLAVLVVLIVVHELGHFLAAKLFGIRVEEFGIGYPPRALTLGKIGETIYSLNWLPFGGFVKIFGEGLGEDVPESERRRALVSQKAWKQAVVFVAGVTFNVIFAWVLFSASFMMGSPMAVDEARVKSGELDRNGPVLAVSAVLPNSPADIAGLKPGDSITALASNSDDVQNPLPSDVSSFIANHAGESVQIYYKRQVSGHFEQELVVSSVEITPSHGVIASKQGTPAIGIEMVLVSAERQGVGSAMILGAQKTYRATIVIAVGIGKFIKSALTGSADWRAVAGPVGIVGLVGDASSLGLLHLLNFTAMISINLAIINLIPIPALDGGRLVFVAIEGVTRRKIHSGVVGALNMLGFAAIILLMLIITYHDVIKIVT
ncbi:MAG: site-2 protease family protein [Candidatus Pacebacteria bacterium]|nr:site-2 protease family protein [Candidatus Paceibacterota bacterium]